MIFDFVWLLIFVEEGLLIGVHGGMGRYFLFILYLLSMKGGLACFLFDGGALFGEGLLSVVSDFIDFFSLSADDGVDFGGMVLLGV